MIYTFNEKEVAFLKENIMEALRKINIVRAKVDVNNSLYQAYDLLMLSAGALEGKILQQGKDSEKETI